MTGDLWEVRDLGGGLTLELRGGGKPALVLIQQGQAIRVELVHVKAVVAALTDAELDLTELLAAGGRQHA